MLAYSVVSVVGLVDIHEAVGGREARSGNELTSNERWSRGLIGGGTFLLSLLPFAPSSRAAAVAGESAEAAAARAALEADVRASLQAAQAERRAAALRRGERQAMVPERPAGPAGEGPVPRPEPVPPVEAPVPPPVEAPVPPRIETPTPAERPIPSEGPVPPVEAPVPPVATTPTPALPGGTGPA